MHSTNAADRHKTDTHHSIMPRLSPVESERTEQHLSYWRERRTSLLSPSHSVGRLSNIDTSGWEMCDDYRTDRFSQNYYRHFHGVHGGGMVLMFFVGMLLLVGGVVGAAFVA